ncbi:hypothetical protein FA15DRAFT_665708 [Coprinopsis marcescibilis]|uniref:Nitrogen permease regulator 3 n=1 Tax=Coprinopsis marcescibilis TaxID=230819 RepID=A0A5C3L5D4_COPMA|nr:hypothetical protein FA15DRAFT_665708 [Coprinopsis marcescibilis]
MAETLLAVVLITTSARGANLVFRWPPDPKPFPRLRRPKPDNHNFISQIDNPWRATFSDHESSDQEDPDYANDPDYRWQRPSSNGSPNFASNSTSTGQYDHLFGYSTEFLASLLCPQTNLCHQKFELVVDDLAFIGHPVCASEDEGWAFRPEKVNTGSRGRGNREKNTSKRYLGENGSQKSASRELSPEHPSKKSTWLQKFQLAFVLDIPDPSSSASGNVLKYFDLIYEQIVFTFTAVLFQEQVLSNFVESECNVLIPMKESFAEQGQLYEEYVKQALLSSSIASAMKAVYEAIKTRSIAYVTLNAIPLELQLPPHLDDLLHNDNELDQDMMQRPDDNELQNWGQELSLGWQLPPLVPWKSLLLLDEDSALEDPIASLRGPHVTREDRTLAEGLIRFLETASITLSLADMSSELDWDLETQIYPVVRWLVQHRRAKVVDTVNPGLKTIFSLPTKLPTPLSDLSKQFSVQFSHPAIPPLPTILSKISSSLAQKSNNHFFASVVKSKDLVPMYHDVVLWMLKHDLLITLHLRIRIVATSEIKEHVYNKRKQVHERRQSKLRGSFTRTARHTQGLELDDLEESDTPAVGWLSLSPTNPRQPSRRISSVDSRKSGISELIIPEDDEDLGYTGEGDDLEEMGSDETEITGSESDNRFSPSMISDPGRATPLQRCWLSAMSEGKDPLIAKRFELINQYFDGKRSDDEILFRAEISRRELREVLHAYDPYLQTFLHPS